MTNPIRSTCLPMEKVERKQIVLNSSSKNVENILFESMKKNRDEATNRVTSLVFRFTTVLNLNEDENTSIFFGETRDELASSNQEKLVCRRKESIVTSKWEFIQDLSLKNVKDVFFESAVIGGNFDETTCLILKYTVDIENPIIVSEEQPVITTHEEEPIRKLGFRVNSPKLAPIFEEPEESNDLVALEDRSISTERSIDRPNEIQSVLPNKPKESEPEVLENTPIFSEKSIDRPNQLSLQSIPLNEFEESKNSKTKSPISIQNRLYSPVYGLPLQCESIKIKKSLFKRITGVFSQCFVNTSNKTIDHNFKQEVIKQLDCSFISEETKKYQRTISGDSGYITPVL